VKAGGSNAARLASDDREGTARRPAAEFPGLTAEDVLESPHVLIGTPEKIAEEVVRRREEYGFSYIVLNTGIVEDIERFAPMVAQLAGR